MKKIIVILSMLIVAGCSNQKLINCNMERQELRIENDVLNQKLVDAADEAAIKKAELSQKLNKSEQLLAQQKATMAELKIIVDQQLPELEKTYNKVKEQLEAANEAVRKELTRNVENKEIIKQLKQQVEQLQQSVENKDKLLNEANEKLIKLTEAVKVMEKEKTEEPKPAEQPKQ